MKGKYFLDTNILVYAHDSQNSKKKKISQGLILNGLKNANIVISTQVLSEFFVTITRKVEKPLSPSRARKEIHLLSNLEISNIGFPLILSAIDQHVKYKISFWDALIIVSAQQSKCNIIYSEDLNDGQQFDDSKIVNPYIHEKFNTI